MFLAQRLRRLSYAIPTRKPTGATVPVNEFNGDITAVERALCLGLQAESYCSGAVSVMGKRAATAALLSSWFRASSSVRIRFDWVEVK